jgi:prevent-host-death family protein
MVEIEIREFQKRFFSFLHQVEAGTELRLMDKGKPVAVVLPYPRYLLLLEEVSPIPTPIKDTAPLRERD